MLWRQADQQHMARQNSGLRLRRTSQWPSAPFCPTKIRRITTPCTPRFENVCFISSMKRHSDAIDGLFLFTQSGSGDNQCKRSVSLKHSDHQTSRPKLPSNQNFQNDQVYIGLDSRAQKVQEAFSWTEYEEKLRDPGLRWAGERKKKESFFLYSSQKPELPWTAVQVVPCTRAPHSRGHEGTQVLPANQALGRTVQLRRDTIS